MLGDNVGQPILQTYLMCELVRIS